MRTLVGKNGLKYAASKTSTTVNTALSEVDLRDGAIGIYGLQGVDPTTAANSHKWVLITDTATGAGKTPKTEFKGNLIRICQGDSSRISGFIEAGIIDISANFKVDAIASSVYTKQISYIGYNPSSLTGFLNFTGLPSIGDIIGLKSYMKREGAYDQDVYEWSVNLNEDEGFFESLSRLVKAINDSVYGGTHFTASITSNAPLDTDPTQTLSIVLGSATGTLGAADAAYAVGAYIRISENVYKIIAVPTATTITFDRPVEEATATIAAAAVNILDITEYPTSGYTQFGIKMLNLLDNEIFNFSVFGNLENSTIEYYQATKKGSGLGSEVLAMERQGLPFRGNMHTAHIEFLTPTSNGQQIPTVTALAASFYDLYLIYSGTFMGEHSYLPVDSVERQKTAIAMEVPALGTGNGDTAGDAQSDFEDILTALYSLTPQIAV